MTAQLELFQTDARTATLSRDRIYRYMLWRRWSDGNRYVQFIGLNPSIADENTDDPTIRKCVKFARTWGYDALCMTNLFAYRATNRKIMMAFSDPIGYGNDRWLVKTAENASLIVCAWSQDGAFNNRAAGVLKLLKRFDLHYLRMSSQPWHPLYLPDATWPSRWPRKDR